MPLVYATPEQLRNHTGDQELDEDRAARLLRTASAIVRHHTRTCVYDTTAAGLPDDPDIADAFRDATLTQAAAWITLAVDPDLGAGAITGEPASSNIGTAEVTYRTRAEQPADKSDTLTDLTPGAAAYLAAVGLVARQPREGRP